MNICLGKGRGVTLEVSVLIWRQHKKEHVEYNLSAISLIAFHALP